MPATEQGETKNLNLSESPWHRRLRALRRNKVAMLGLGIIQFFLYGHVVNLLPDFVPALLVLLVWVALFIALAYWVLRKLRHAVPLSQLPEHRRGGADPFPAVFHCHIYPRLL